MNMTAQLDTLNEIWPNIQHIFSVPHTEEDYQRLVTLLDALVDTVGEDEAHPLAPIMETLGQLISYYEDEHYPQPQATPIDSLKLLMQEHDLTPIDLTELGDQTIVSSILAGQRSLTLDQIKQMSRRFKVSPLVFIDD